VDTRQDRDLVIIARTDARAVEGLGAAIERVNRYMEAGADMGFVEAPQSAEELAEVGKRVTPAVANVFEGGKTPVLPAAELERMGFRLGIYPSQTQRAAIFAINETLAVLRRDGDTKAVENRMATFADREDAVDAKRWREIEGKYLRDI
jgi:2-methylisocitrate lyase-like PEP mutase family enzyme